MSSRVTRRELAVVLAAPALLAQAPAPVTDPLDTLREQMRHNSELLAKVDVPAAIEPAVHFKAG